MTIEKRVDESWKESVAREKEVLKQTGSVAIEPPKEKEPPAKAQVKPSPPADDEPLSAESGEEFSDEAASSDINFLNYVSSLAFQAMIFLGEIPNPMTNETDENLEQAKMLIDTLAMLREKTKGNLSAQENNLLSGSIYELQMKYVERVQKKG